MNQHSNTHKNLDFATKLIRFVTKTVFIISYTKCNYNQRLNTESNCLIPFSLYVRAVMIHDRSLFHPRGPEIRRFPGLCRQMLFDRRQLLAQTHQLLSVAL